MTGVVAVADEYGVSLTGAGPVVGLETIRGWGACPDGYRAVARLYPAGVPVDLAVWRGLADAGVDVLWGAVRLLTDDERVELTLFTLRQRQPHVVARFERAGLPEQAAAIAALTFETPEDAGRAIAVFDSAWDSAWDSAYRETAKETLAWIFERVAVRYPLAIS